MTLALLLGLLQAASSPGELAGHVLVYSARERAVLLIGGDAVGTRPIYELAGKSWTALPGSELPVRTLPAVAADEEGDLLMHGGSLGIARPDGTTDFQVTADTWRWKGGAWTRVATSGPAARDHHAMVFDAHRKVFVLFGGSDADPSGRTVLYGDTWEWRGEAWVRVAENGPSPRAHHAMVFDPLRNATLVLGGNDDDRTWAWDGTKWEVVAKGPPAQRSSPRLAFDAKAARVILFGGSVGEASPQDTWAWDGESWSVLATSGPPGRSVHALAFDEARGAAILFGGADRASVFGDLWQLSGGAWTRLGPN